MYDVFNSPGANLLVHAVFSFIPWLSVTLMFQGNVQLEWHLDE